VIEYSGMKPRNQVKKYGDSAHYWPVEMQPFLVAGALIDIVLESCEKTRLAFREVKEA